MSRRAQENLVGVIVLGVFCVMLYMTLGYSSRARLVPLPVTILGIVLTVAQLLWQNLRERQELRVNILDLVGGGAAGAKTSLPSDSKVPEAGRPGGELSALSIVALLLVLVLVIGPVPAVFLFTAGYLALTKHCSPLRAVVYAGLCVGILYGLFGFALGVQLNRGMLAGFIGEYVDF